MALELKPNFANAYTNYGSLLAILGRNSEAENHFQKALEINPNLAEAHYNYGVLLKNLGQR